MYLEYFGLQEKPFSLTPDPRFLFLSDSHRQALDHMLYGVREREGFILIVGDIGTGKTTICRELLEKLEDNVASALILNPMLSEQELLEAILQDFGIGTGQAGGGEDGEHKSRELFSRLDEQTQAALELNPLMPGHEVLDSILQEVAPPADGSMTKKDLIDRLNAFLLKLAGTGGNAVLIVDESQNLSPQVLEQIRILSNLETPKQKLLQIVLVGQLELKRKLEQADLRQLNQRISVRYQLGPLSTEDAKRYIEHRLFVAGSNSSVAFSDQAHEAIYEYSRGVPRLINLVCERCMLGAYVDQVKRVDRDLVERCRHSLESNLEQEGSESPVQVDGGHIQGPEAEPKEAVLEGAPEEAVDQPWERRLHRRMAAHMGWGRWAGRPAILAGLVVVIVIFAAWAVFFRAGPTEATVSRKAATAAALEAVEREITSVRLNYSIQLSAFPNLEDCRAQERLLTGKGISSGTYIVPLHRVELGGSWYRLFYGSFPSEKSANEELTRLVSRGSVKADIARIVETPLAFNLGRYVGEQAVEKKRSQYLTRLRIPCYALPLENREGKTVFRLYAGAFEEKNQAAFLGDRLETAGLKCDLVERLGAWPRP